MYLCNVQDSDPGRRWHTIPAQEAVRAVHAPGMTWQNFLEYVLLLRTHSLAMVALHPYESTLSHFLQLCIRKVRAAQT